MLRRVLTAVAATVLALAVPATAEAAPTYEYYPSSAAFQAAIQHHTVETFTGVNRTSQTAGSFAFPGFTATKEYASPGLETGQSGNTWMGRPTTALADVFTFDRPLYAWAANIDTNVGGNGAGIIVEILLETGWEGVAAVGTFSFSNAEFIGFSSTELFSAVRIATFSGVTPDVYTLDNMMFAVPEPATLWLFGVALLAFAEAGRRRGFA